jgi:hypothetical protein
MVHAYRLLVGCAVFLAACGGRTSSDASIDAGDDGDGASSADAGLDPACEATSQRDARCAGETACDVRLVDLCEARAGNWSQPFDQVLVDCIRNAACGANSNALDQQFFWCVQTGVAALKPSAVVSTLFAQFCSACGIAATDCSDTLSGPAHDLLWLSDREASLIWALCFPALPDGGQADCSDRDLSSCVATYLLNHDLGYPARYCADAG